MEGFAATFGWYGKTPSAGDFISRRLARGTIDALDAWFQKGMTGLREGAPETWQRDYAAAPIWNALLPSSLVSPSACLAVVAASSDRVGRRYPFCVIGVLPAATPARFASIAARCDDLSRLVDQSIRASIGTDEFDQRLQTVEMQLRDEDSRSSDAADIGTVLDDLAFDTNDLVTVPLNTRSAFPWPDLARAFEPAGATSYWWSSAHTGRPVGGGFTHIGALDAALFLTLFGEPTGQSQSTLPPS